MWAPVHRPSTGRLVGTWVAVVGVAAAMIYVSNRGTPSDASTGPPPLTIASFVFTLIPFMLVAGLAAFIVYPQVRLHWQRATLQWADTYVVTADSVIVVDGPARTQYQWEAFDRWTETDGLFFVGLTSAVGWVVLPKRSAGSAGVVEATRDLLAGRLPSEAADAA